MKPYYRNFWTELWRHFFKARNRSIRYRLERRRRRAQKRKNRYHRKAMRHA